MLQLEIIKEFDRIIKDATESRSLKEYLEDVDRYGQDEFVYYSETTELYDDYQEECEKWLNDLVDRTGMAPWELFPRWDYAVNSRCNKWAIVTAMFEEHCRYLLDGLDQ